MPDNTPVSLDSPCIDPKRAIIVGIRRRHRVEGFDVTEQPYAIVANRLGNGLRDPEFTLWHEWLPTSGSSHAGDERPEFVYGHGLDDLDEQRNGPRNVDVPVSG